MKLLQGLADSALIALENVRLYKDLELRVKELEAANRAKNEFLMTLSHELRTPMNAIIGWTELLLEDNLHSPDTRNGLETILRNASSQNQLINDLLDMTRLSGDQFTLTKTRVDLVKVLKECISSIMPLCYAKAIKIEANSLPFVGSCLGDYGRLKQIFLYLLSNAIKFTEIGGSITISMTRVGPNAEIEIKDNGAGIAPECLLRVFDRFWQNDSSKTRKHGGLGLGLAIVKALTEAHGGQVAIESEGLGKGVKSTVTLPLETIATEILEASHQVQPKPLPNIRVLLVDDEPEVLNLVSTVLERQGSNVKTVLNAIEALSILDHFIPDVLISDVSMPEMDGYTMIRKIREDSACPAVPAIALTAFADLDHELEAMSAGFNKFMGKPPASKTISRNGSRAI